MDMIKALFGRLASGLSSNSGNNAQAATWIALGVFVPVIASFEKEEYKLAAFVAFCGVMAIIAWRTKGSGLKPEEGEAIREKLDTLSQVLDEGRQ